MRRFIPLGTALAVAAASLTLAIPTANAGTADGSNSARITATRFALAAAAYGTKVEGGQIPASSGTTSYMRIGCTNKAGLMRKNFEASLTLPGLGKVEGVTTKTWTKLRPKKREVNVYSSHNVAKVVLGDGQLVLKAVNSLSRVWHDSKGFHTSTTTSIGEIVAQGESSPLPTPDQPITIPGLATIAVGDHHERSDKTMAYAAANAVRILLIPSDTRIRIAHTAALMGSGITYGRFHGQSNGTQVRALDDNLKSGPTPLSYMPCQGTHGKILTKSIAGVDLGGQIVVGAIENQQMGKQDTKKAKGFEQSKIATVSLGGGQLIINAIKARANVTRFKSGKYVRNANGTTIGEIVANGEPQAIPPPGQSLEIPGLAKLEANIVTKTRKGIDVVAVRITLLDGTGAVIDLGHAFLLIKPSGRRFAS